MAVEVGTVIRDLVGALKGKPGEARRIVQALSVELPEAERRTRRDAAVSALRDATAEHARRLAPLAKAQAEADKRLEDAIRALEQLGPARTAAHQALDAESLRFGTLRSEQERVLEATLPAALLELREDVADLMRDMLGLNRFGHVTRGEQRIVELPPEPPGYAARVSRMWFSNRRSLEARAAALHQLSGEVAALTVASDAEIFAALPKLRARLTALRAEQPAMEPAPGPQAA